jgi:tetratricopeptide (TPR) repeat protein
MGSRMPEVRGKAKGKARAKAAAVTPQAKRSGSRWWIYAAASAAAVLAVFLVYGPAIGGPFVFDDISQPYQRPNYPSELSAWIQGVRPLLMFSYWVNYQISQEPTGFHITNLLIHLLNGGLIFLIVRKMLGLNGRGGRDLLAAFAAAVFLLHPLQTESVAYVAGRSEALSVLFFLGAFAVFLYRGAAAVSWKTAAAVLVLFGAAVATKEHTLVLPALLLLTDYYWNPGFSFAGIRRNWRVYVPIAVGAAGGAAFVANVLAHAGRSAGFGIKEFTWYQYFFTQCRAFFVYLRLLVFPAGQNLDWEYAISRNLMDHGAIVGLVVILALAAAAIYYRRRFPLASYGFFVYLLLMAPTSSFVPIKDPIAERRLYLPMIGILLLVTAGLQYVRMDRRKLAAALGAVVLVLAVVTWQRNQLWASDIAIWEDAASKSPGKPRVHFQLAHTYANYQRYPEAIAQYAETAELEPPPYDLLYDWGLALTDGGHPEQGLLKLQQAAAMEPSAQVYTEMARAYIAQKRWQEALEALAQAEKLDAGYYMIYDNRGGIRANLNDFAGAAADYQHSLELNPANDHARQMLGIVQQRLRQPAPR